MKTHKAIPAAILTGYVIPWSFLALYGDKTYDTVLLYGLLFLVTAILAWLCRRNNLSVLCIAGNILSCTVSCYCSQFFFGNESWYFKPFGVIGWVLALSLFTLMVQFLIWNYKKDLGPARALLVGMCAVCLLFAAAIMLMLIYTAWSFGAL